MKPKEFEQHVASLCEAAKGDNKVVWLWKIATTVFLQAILPEGDGPVGLELIWDPARCRCSYPPSADLSELGLEGVTGLRTVEDCLMSPDAGPDVPPTREFHFPPQVMRWDASQILRVGVPVAKKFMQLGEHDRWLKKPRRVCSLG